MGLLLGIDIGTSNIKTSVFSDEGKEISTVSREHPLHSPRPGWVEQDPNRWWELVRETIGAAFSAGNASPADVGSIGVSSQSWGVVPVGRRGEVIRPALLWMDRRSISQSEMIEKRMAGAGRDVLVDPSFIVPKLLWIKEEEPRVYRDTRKFLQVNSFINFRLCGEACTDISQEDPLQIFIRSHPVHAGPPDFYESLGIAPDKVPDVRGSSEVIGTVTGVAARETGLRAGTPVVAGAMDTSASALGMGIVGENQTFHVAGQAGAIGVCRNRPSFDRRLCIHNHVIPDKWLIVGVMVATGASMRWVRDLFAGASPANDESRTPDLFHMLSAQAGEAAGGAGGVIFLPYLMGERTPMWDYEARGVFFGLSLKTGKRELIRAVMEGVAFALRHNIEVLESSGVRIDEILCTGGAVNSALWNQIKANVTKRTLRCIDAFPATTMGAAIVAARGIGMTVEPFTPGAAGGKTRVFRPDRGAGELYDRLFEIYKRLYRNLKNEFAELALARSTGRIV